MSSFLGKVWTLLKVPVNRLIDLLQAKFPANRIVVLLTPLAFAPAAGYVTAYVAQHFPGLPQFSAAQITGLFVTGALIAFGKAYKWLDGWQASQGLK